MYKLQFNQKGVYRKVFSFFFFFQNNCKKITKNIHSGRNWLPQIITKDECLAKKGCKENVLDYCAYKANGDTGNVDLVTNKTEEECKKCGGNYVKNKKFDFIFTYLNTNTDKYFQLGHTQNPSSP